MVPPIRHDHLAEKARFRAVLEEAQKRTQAIKLEALEEVLRDSARLLEERAQ
jgi:hypothetical protein